MKNALLKAGLTLAGLAALSSFSLASGWRHHRHYYYYSYYRPHVVYVERPYYYVPPPVVYYAPPPVYYRPSVFLGARFGGRHSRGFFSIGF